MVYDSQKVWPTFHQKFFKFPHTLIFFNFWMLAWTIIYVYYDLSLSGSHRNWAIAMGIVVYGSPRFHMNHFEIPHFLIFFSHFVIFAFYWTQRCQKLLFGVGFLLPISCQWCRFEGCHEPRLTKLNSESPNSVHFRHLDIPNFFFLCHFWLHNELGSFGFRISQVIIPWSHFPVSASTFFCDAILFNRDLRLLSQLQESIPAIYTRHSDFFT